MFHFSLYSPEVQKETYRRNICHCYVRAYALLHTASQLHSNDAVSKESSAWQQDPTTQATSTLQRPSLNGGNSLDLPVSICQQRGHVILALSFSFGPRCLTGAARKASTSTLCTTHLTCETAPGPETSPVVALQLLLSLLF